MDAVWIVLILVAWLVPPASVAVEAPPLVGTGNSCDWRPGRSPRIQPWSYSFTERHDTEPAFSFSLVGGSLDSAAPAARFPLSRDKLRQPVRSRTRRRVTGPRRGLRSGFHDGQGHG
jgi:hypothetical protein